MLIFSLALSAKPSLASDWERQAYFVTASSFWAKLAEKLDKTIMIYLSIDRRSQSKLIIVAVFMEICYISSNSVKVLAKFASAKC